MSLRCLTDAKHPPWAYEASHGIAGVGDTAYHSRRC